MKESSFPKKFRFKRNSSSWNLYRDLFLFWPLLALTCLSCMTWWDSHATNTYRFKTLTAAVVIFMLLKEKLFMLGTCCAALACYSLYVMIRYPQNLTTAIVGFVCSSLATAVIAWFKRRDRPSYEFPNDLGLVEFVILTTSLFLAFSIIYVVRR